MCKYILTASFWRWKAMFQCQKYQVGHCERWVQEYAVHVDWACSSSLPIWSRLLQVEKIKWFAKSAFARESQERMCCTPSWIHNSIICDLHCFQTGTAERNGEQNDIGSQGRQSRGSNCFPKYISEGAALPQLCTGAILYIQNSQRALFTLSVRNWQ